MRSIWKGSVSVGLVSVPVALYPATKREELRFRLLRASDLSPVNYKRVAQTDGKEVPWDQIVKGYEYEKGRFVVFRDEDFRRVDVEATETIAVMDFVALDQINPMYFQKPYYLEPQKGAAPAYVLLRDALRQSDKAGIAKVVIRSRQHLAAIRAVGDALVLEIMHFAHELVDASGLAIPHAQTEMGAREMRLAKQLVDDLTVEWDPSRYHDDYQSAVLALVEERVEAGQTNAAAPAPGRAPRRAGNVVDLMTALEQSLRQTGGRGKREPASPPRTRRRPARKASPSRAKKGRRRTTAA